MTESRLDLHRVREELARCLIDHASEVSPRICFSTQAMEAALRLLGEPQDEWETRAFADMRQLLELANAKWREMMRQDEPIIPH